MSTRPMAQNYDPATGIALMGACDPSCRIPCEPICPLDPERSVRAIFGPPGMEVDMSNSWSAFTCPCNRTDQHGLSDCRAFDDAADTPAATDPATQARDEDMRADVARTQEVGA